MRNRAPATLATTLLSLMVLIGLSSPAFGTATIVIQNADPAGVGFNDPTPVAHVGNNLGNTLGQQRLNAFQTAAAIWGATLTSTPTITVHAQWTALDCTDTTAVLGSAGASEVFRDFATAPHPGTWYSFALANKLSGTNLDPPTAQINADFNVNLGNSGCLTGTHFYLGLDNNHGTNIDLVAVLIHEFSHGLGFQTFTNGSTGAQFMAFPSVYDWFLTDTSTGKTWQQMTDAERTTSALNTRKLVWNGPQVTNDVPSVLTSGTPLLKINSPQTIAGNYDVGTASFGPALSSPGITGIVAQAHDAADGVGPLTTDACSPMNVVGEVSGRIALVDRGTCSFTVKTKNAQDAGAIGVLIADNVAGGPPPGLGGTDPTITIPAVRITQAAGIVIMNSLTTGINATLSIDPSVFSGADPLGRALLFTPNPYQGGSSVSHWDSIAFPNQLLEPDYNDDVTHSVTPPKDLTFSLLRDIGWLPAGTPSTTVQLGVASNPGEGDGSVAVTVVRAGDRSGTTSVDYATSDTAGLSNCAVVGGVASSRCDYVSSFGTLRWAPGETLKTITIPIINDSYAEGSEMFSVTLSNPIGATLGSSSTTTVMITDNETVNGTNPIDQAGFFVRQHYLDFLNREPDASGLAFWTNEISSCGADAQCTEVKRINASAAFYLSIEFQETGYLVYRIYKGAYGNLSNPVGAPVPVRFSEFLPDTQLIGQGLVVGQTGWETVLENNKQAFVAAFVQRSRFANAYATTMQPAQFVDALYANATVTPSASERQDAINEFPSQATTTSDVAARARVLRRVAENSTLAQQEFNKAFVLMQYFGYLRRNPNDAPDTDFSGYNFWFGKLNDFNGNFVNAEMVKAFITSTEYRQRFGP